MKSLYAPGNKLNFECQVIIAPSCILHILTIFYEYTSYHIVQRIEKHYCIISIYVTAVAVA